MKVGHGLPGVRAVIGNDAKTTCQQTLLGRNLGRQGKRIGRHLGITRLDGA